MVRQSKQTPDKKDAHRKKAPHHDKPSPKKPADAAIWPCSINGCNKQFAREADLKRHQRTTKLHSVPGFSCPQCDARFTRTDALRRHQKSRHNGVVIEPADGLERRRSTGEDSASRSHSRSRTPPSKENPAPLAPPASGSQSYYRQHTFPGILIPPGMIVDGYYPPAAGLPTSATRLHQASWEPAPHSWPADASQPPHMISPGYPHPYYNPPPHYYRPDAMMHAPDVAQQHMPNSIDSSNCGSSSSRQGSPVLAVDPSLDRTDPEITDREPVVIDPSLVSPTSSAGSESPCPSLNYIPVRDSSADGPRVPARSSSTSVQHIPSPGTNEPPNVIGDSSDSESAVVQSLLSPTRDHYASPAPLEHSLEMEQILTEDGEPMLNPAELLTQESLASPPPS